MMNILAISNLRVKLVLYFEMVKEQILLLFVLVQLLK